MDLIQWQPFGGISRLRDQIDRMFEDSLWPRNTLMPAQGNVLIDMYQTDNDVMVKASLPGVNPDEVDITVTGDILTIKGEHKEEKEAKEENYYHKERRFGSFSRIVALPVPVKNDKAEAVFEDGVLTLTLPKSEELKPKQIKVKSKKAVDGEKK